MRLVRGARLGPYEILAPLGAGGMGEVYRARDMKLEREVAIKILPDALAQNPERLARFAREAKVLASLNHPNIAQIYGVEDRALVMELAPGQTLFERIAAGPVPVKEALQIGAQIAEALAAAHERGVIHRDLKPANVKVTPDGRVKVLDFGLAKPFVEESSGDDSHVETLTGTMTQTGTIVGTPGYMSPEQARGRAVDKRTDIWALGCVLYELLTQCRAFGGETSSDTIAAVLEREPAWDALPPAMPQRVRDLLQRCLRKDMRRRARDAGDIAIELEEAVTAPTSVEPSGLALRPRSRWMRAVPFLLAATAIAAALAGGYLQRALGPSAPASMTRLTALLPPNDRFATGLCPDIAVSPDGKLVAYIGVHAGRSQIFLRAMDSSEATAVPGTERASDTVFFSPDGQWLAFLQSNPYVLRKIPVSGGAPVTLASTPGCGGDWGPDDQIFLGRTDGIFQISAGGGALKPLVTIDLSKGEQGLGFPQLLPGGKAMLFTVQTDQGFQIVAQRLASGERHILVKGDDPPPTGASGRYAPPGFLVYSQADGLMAAQFSVERLELTGPPVTIARGGGQIGSQFSLSRSAETLAYVPSEPRPPSTLVWVNRKGAEEAMGTVPGQYSLPRLSPDDHKVVLAADSNIWLYDIARRTLTRITSGGDNRSPVWTPDGSRITYTKNGAICWILADGNSHEDSLWKGTFGLPSSWSPNGERLLFTEMRGDNQIDISVLSVKGERTATPVVQSRFVQAEAIFSPDERRFAYSSKESGQFEIYLREFPGPGGKTQISSEGGSNPVWGRNGRELFYLNGDKMMVVDITAAPVFQPAIPRVLFERRYNHATLRNFDVTADGQRFVMIKSGGAAPPVTQLNVVLNWLGDVRRRAAAK